MLNCLVSVIKVRLTQIQGVEIQELALGKLVLHRSGSNRSPVTVSAQWSVKTSEDSEILRV